MSRKARVVEREDVTLRIEGIVSRTHRCPAMNALRRPRHTRRRRRWDEPPHVDVTLALLEWRGREQYAHQTAGVALELATLGRRVAVAEDQQVELARWVA